MRMTSAPVCEEVAVMNAAISCVVRPSTSAAGEAVRQGLRAAGMKVATFATVYDFVAEAARLGGRLRHLILGVDFFGRDDFRVIPLVRREWPETMIVAYHSPGFEHKGQIADLVGADLVLRSPEDIARFLEMLAPGLPVAAAPPLAEAAAVASREAAASRELELPEASPAASASGSGAAAARAEPATSSATTASLDAAVGFVAAASRKAAAAAASRERELAEAPPAALASGSDEDEGAVAPLDTGDFADSRDLSRVELTEEELRMLLGEDGDEDRSGGQP